jgi:hypothetical protein
MALVYVKIFTLIRQIPANHATLWVYASNVSQLQCVLNAITTKGMKNHPLQQISLVYAEVTFQRSTASAFCALSLVA